MPNLFWAYRNKITNRLWGVVHMPAIGERNGDVLISYITEPFTRTPWAAPSTRHTNYWECAQMAHLFATRGYAVDIVNWENQKFIPRSKYRVCVDIHNNLERFSHFLPNDCKKVLHIVSASYDFQNAAEMTRIESLRARRGILIAPQRQVSPGHSAAIADYLEGFGNATVHATYARFNKPIFPIPISAVKLFEFPEKKDFNSVRKTFLWLGGGGAVLKGLDLVLEAFAQNPDLTLHICGPVAAEKDFAIAYKKELYETPNIHFHGRINVDSDVFKTVADTCGGLIYPAFSEGTSGAVVQAMHAGVIPIVTPQTGIYEDASCIKIDNPTVESVREALRAFAGLPAKEIEDRARATWAYARAHYTRESFSKAYAAFIDTVLQL